MKYYRINLIPRVHKEYAHAEYPPGGTEAFTYLMAEGSKAAHRYPKGAKVKLEKGGTKLPSLVGNTDSFLIVSKEVKEVIEKSKVDKIEYLPLIITDSKDKILSNDYFIINPLGTYDCLDKKKSEIEYFEGDVVGVDKFVADKKKLADAPDLFRVPEAPHEYFMSEKLVLALKKIKATNIFVYSLD